MSPRIRGVGLALVVAALAGCSQTVVAPPPDTSPTATSPAGAVRRFEWAMNQNNVDAIAVVVPEEFAILGAGVDSSGNATRTAASDRSWFLAALSSMLQGVPGRYDPAQVQLVLDHNLIALPDTRPGKDSRWHKQIRTSVDLKVRIDSGNSAEVYGNALFFLCRGDSAVIPYELLQRGAKHDSTTWWLDRVEDETLAGADPPLPGKNRSLLQLLEYYYKRLTP